MKKHHIEYVEVVGVDGGSCSYFFIPLYNEMFRGCFTVGERKISKKLMINGEFVIEWKKKEKAHLLF